MKALLFGCAVNSVLCFSEKVAWHHYVIVECSSCTFAVELLRRGVHVRLIAVSQPRTAQAMFHHRMELKSNQTSSRQISIAEELETVELDCERGLQPVIKWLQFVVNHAYDVCSWNCQHFSSDLIAILSSFVRRDMSGKCAT